MMDEQNLWSRGGLVELLNSQDANYIHLAGNILNEKGIFNRVENEITNIIPGMSVGVSLMVKSEELNLAKKALEDADLIPKDKDTPEELQRHFNQEQKENRRRIYNLILLLILLLLVCAIWVIYINQKG